MRSLNEVVANPGGLDSSHNYLGQEDFPSMYVVLTRTRDSNLIDNCNFEVALKELGGESDDVVIYSFGHWACGWWEALCVKKDSPKFNYGVEIQKRIEDYPLLDEDIYFEQEYQAKVNFWNNCSMRERVEMCRNLGLSIFSARRFPDEVRDEIIIDE